MSRVILHIGTHKTATTTIQDMFAHNAGVLAKHGVIYPRMGRMTGHHGLVTDWITTMPQIYHYRKGSIETLRDIARSHGDSETTVFLSSEEFSRATPATRPDFAVIRAALSGFDRIEVVCVLREQWQFLQSIYLEVSKTRQPQRPPEFLEAVLTEDMADGLWTDYTLLYQNLLQVFAPDEITFLDFDQCRRAEGGVIGTMLRHLDIPLATDQLDLVNNGQSNISPKALPAWAANVIAAPHIAPVWMIEAVTGAFDVQFGAATPSCLWTQSELATLLDYAAVRNELLEASLQPYQPEFRMSTTDFAAKTVIYREHLNADFWMRTSRWIFASARRYGVT